MIFLKCRLVFDLDCFRGLPSHQQQQMLNLRATNQASLLNANPMLQRALLMQQMQGNLRGFNMTAPALQQFFPQATRSSLLGPPPVGVSLKPTRLGFPGLPFQRQNRMFRKDFPRGLDRKRELDQASSSQTQGAEGKVEIPEGSQIGSEQNDSSTAEPQTPVESLQDNEPAAKRLRSVGEGSALEDATGSQEADEPSLESQTEGTDSTKEHPAEGVVEEKNFSEEPKPSEVLSSGGSLKVTIQQSSESRAISTTALKPAHWACEIGPTETNPEAAVKFYCYICKTNCCNQQNFQSHMAGIQHQQRLREIQHMSNVCFISLLPMVKEQKSLAEKDGDTQQRWCNSCQRHFMGDLIKHRRTHEHKLAKRSLRPFCTVCSRHFKTPRKFVEHMKSPEHKQKAKEVRLGEKELGGPEDSEELITVDAVGCFEDDDDDDDDDDEEEEEGAGEEESPEGVPLENEESGTKQAGLKEASVEDSEGNEKYCPDSTYGLDFLVPVAGYLCRLCHKFYHSDSAARLAHCKSLMHFENFQRYKAARHRATPAHTEASLHHHDPGFQSLDDQPPLPAAKLEDETETANAHPGAGKEETELLALQEQSSRSPESQKEPSTFMPGRESPASETDLCGTLLMEEGGEESQDGERSLTLSDDGLLVGDAAESLGGCKQKEEESDGAKPKGGTDTTQHSEGEDYAEANEAAVGQGQEQEVQSLSPGKGETSISRRRSARRKPR
uniref:CDKN1A interacting zinc finger protein 1 n=1 Tax=Sphenodon punctatus TaxID=8508 RepID=A0A8D0HH70_SPHPU